MRPRAQTAAENDASFGGIHGVADVSRVDDVAAVGEIIGGAGNRHREGPANPGRGSLRPGKGEGTHTRLPGGKKAATGRETPYSVLPRASGSGENLARQVDRAGARTQVRAHFARRHAR